MRAWPISYVPILLFVFLSPAQATETGRLAGKIASECGEPLGYASTVLIGMDRGALSDSSGAFLIEDIPPGTYIVSVNSFGRSVTRAYSVSIASGETTHLDVTLTSVRHAGTYIETARSNPRCEAHKIPLELVHVGASIGLLGVPAGYEEALRDSFPHGEAFHNGGCDPSGSWDAWIYQCPLCIAAHNRWKKVEERDYRGTAEPTDWVTYANASEMTFRAPIAADTSSRVTGCVEAHTWRWPSLSLSSWIGPWRVLPKIPNEWRFHHEVIDSECVAMTRVQGPKDAESVWCDIVRPGGDLTLRMEITQDSHANVPEMLAVLRSMKFPGRVRP